MNRDALLRFVRSRFVPAAAAGLLLAAAFPKPGIAGLAWVVPGLMVATALGRPGGEAFRLGYIAGLAFWLASLSWLLLIPVRGFPLVGWLALSGYLALYPAGWVWFCQRLLPPHAATREPPSLFASLGQLHQLPLIHRARWAFLGAAAWVALEMIRSRLFSGFPWSLLGVSQAELVPLLQISATTGVYGVSFLVAWSSLGLLSAAAALGSRAGSRAVWAGDLVLPLLAVAVVFATGYRQLLQPEPAGRTLRVTAVQPSIPQTLIWDSQADDQRFAELLQLSDAALAEPADLLVWPEAAVPKLLRWNEPTFRAVTNLVRTHRVWMVLGADDAEPRPATPDPDDADYFNSAWLVDPAGRLVDYYRKRQLVIFGEYVPLAGWLPFLKWFTPIGGGFTAGDHAQRFVLADTGLRLAPLICFEDVFPHVAREGADDADLLVNLTNNGWFGEGAAQEQHAANAVFRAIENGRPLLRCANNGLTCWVDARGRIRDRFVDAAGTIYGRGFKRMELSLPAAGARPATFYQENGDVFGWACVAFTAVGLGLGLRPHRKGTGPTHEKALPEGQG